MSKSDLLGVVIAVSAFIICFILYLSKNKGQNRTYSNYSGQTYSRKHLEKMVLGDKAVAQRLIDAEKNLRPNNSEQDLIKLAVERLIRDNR